VSIQKKCSRCSQANYTDGEHCHIISDLIQIASEERQEYRELVKQYAGQIFAGLCSNSLYDFKDADRMTESIVSKAHALATEVLASLNQKEG
jgi:hypothetical protein